MNKLKLSIGISLLSLLGLGQNSIAEAIEKYNSNTVEYITVEALKAALLQDSSLVLLDAREAQEYKVSHLKDAIHVGYKNFNLQEFLNTTSVKKSDRIVVYCSIGVRSEEIGEQLKASGFEQVQNLYGGLFEWSNKGFLVYSLGNTQTKRVHPYNDFWGKFLTKAQKSYR